MSLITQYFPNALQASLSQFFEKEKVSIVNLVALFVLLCTVLGAVLLPTILLSVTTIALGFSGLALVLIGGACGFVSASGVMLFGYLLLVCWSHLSFP